MSEKFSELITSQEHVITSAEADIHGTIRPGAFVNLLIQAAITSADSLGFGLAFLRDNNLFWVLSRLSVSIERDIRWQEKVIIETWPRDVDGLFYLRDFLVRDTKNNVIGRATSAWLCVDLNRKRPVKMPDYDDVFRKLRDRTAWLDFPVKLGPSQFNDEDTKEISPVYSDFDLNGHVTTVRYIDWVMDSYSFSHHDKYVIERIDVNFQRETLPEGRIYMLKAVDDGSDNFSGWHTDGKLSFQMKVSFREREK